MDGRKVLISAPYIIPVMDDYQELFAERDIELVIPRVRERLSEEELLPLVGDIDGVICGDDAFTEKVLSAAPKLKVISKWGTGIDSIDVEACHRFGIAVRNTPNAFSEPVADSVFGYILTFARRIPDTQFGMCTGAWNKLPCKALNECVLGVIGVGNVGKAVIRRAHGFGMKVLANDIVKIPRSYVYQNNVEMGSLKYVLAYSDFITIHCTLNPTSYHLLGLDEFELIQPTAYLINTARGSVIDEEALFVALRLGWLAGAALDVFEEEPLPADSPLRNMSNVLLSPHNANSCPYAWARVHRSTIAHLFEELDK